MKMICNYEVFKNKGYEAVRMIRLSFWNQGNYTGDLEFLDLQEH